jgi:hypothetical protein
MKMDAMQKRKLWKAAIGHFALTVLAIALIFPTPFGAGSIHEDFWWTLKTAFFTLLQPQLYFLGLFQSSQALICLLFISIPAWSICFAWILVKLDNWLNHFPVLGKKVFEIVNLLCKSHPF